MDCAAATPICGSDQTCRKCRSHSECVSGVCTLAGSCALSTDIALVNNGNAAPTTCKLTGTHDGTSAATAYCDIQDAVNGTKPYALVTGSTAAYGAVTINNRNITLVGPGFAATTTAQIQGLTTQGIVVQGNSIAVIDGFEVTATTGSKEGILCLTSGTASLTAVRNWVHNNGGNGISATACTAVVDANLVGPSNASGLSFGAGTSYTATNNLVFRNSSTGVILASNASGTFQFNSVAGNGGASIFGGIDCGSATKLIERSIIATNTTAGTPASQFTGSCALLDVVVGTAEMSALPGSRVDPHFVNASSSPYNYRLVKPNDAANLSCCVDKVSTTVDGGSSMLPDHDIDFTTRPQGVAWDIGGHEAQ